MSDDRMSEIERRLGEIERRLDMHEVGMTRIDGLASRADARTSAHREHLAEVQKQVRALNRR